MPEHYCVPEHGELREDVEHALIALRQGRSTYIWGLPGSGKDALFHAWSALTRTPCLLKQIKPGTDIESWFFSRGFNEQGTYWEEGAVLKALRDGYTTSTGEVIPYLLLISDFDRADREQAEHMRLITDSIQGRIDGPAGVTYKVLPGTRIVATGNTAGSGDDRGRMISANPIDASLLDRFERKFQFHWLDWADEEIIVRSKFPILVQRCPEIFNKVGKITEVIRKAILDGELYAEFSHRGVCAILGHTQDILSCRDAKIPRALLKQGIRAWIDGLPDQENRDIALKLMSAHVSMIVEGDTSHINNAKTLINGF
jgi:MoxR-like ATPase